jgi:BirA family biotin operon repressor/biotin-[acetyl-CoA-carboxylase] ligase
VVPLGHTHLHFNSLPSTQDWLADHWPQWPDGFVVTADDQTAGRGQAGRAWHSAPGLNFTGSILLRDRPLPAQRPFQLNKAAALAVRDAVADLLGTCSGLQVKWPNDVVTCGRKLAGILPQLVWQGSRLEAVVLGIGLNVNEQAFPPELAGRATSLNLLAGRPFDLHRVRATLCRCLDARLHQVASAPAQLDADYLAGLYRYQEWAQYRHGQQTLTASIVGVDLAGGLVLESEGGLLRVQPCEIEYL